MGLRVGKTVLPASGWIKTVNQFEDLLVHNHLISRWMPSANDTLEVLEKRSISVSPKAPVFEAF